VVGLEIPIVRMIELGLFTRAVVCDVPNAITMGLDDATALIDGICAPTGLVVGVDTPAGFNVGLGTPTGLGDGFCCFVSSGETVGVGVLLRSF
jgi:hypothetical protein